MKTLEKLAVGLFTGACVFGSISCDGGSSNTEVVDVAPEEKRVITFAGDAEGKLGVLLTGARLIVDINGNKVLDTDGSSGGPMRIDAAVDDAIDIEVVAGDGGGSVGDIFLASEGIEVQAKNGVFTKLSSAVSTTVAGAKLVDRKVQVAESAVEVVEDEALPPFSLLGLSVQIDADDDNESGVLIFAASTFQFSTQTEFEPAIPYTWMAQGDTAGVLTYGPDSEGFSGRVEFTFTSPTTGTFRDVYTGPSSGVDTGTFEVLSGR